MASHITSIPLRTAAATLLASTLIAGAALAGTPSQA